MMNLRFTQINMLKNHFIKAFIEYKETIDPDVSAAKFKNFARFNWNHMEEFIPCYLLRCMLRSMEEVMKWQATLPDVTLPKWLEIKAFWMEHKKRYLDRLENINSLQPYKSLIPKA
jgi:hypothetical protein